jgi:O-antigen ligase
LFNKYTPLNSKFEYIKTAAWVFALLSLFFADIARSVLSIAMIVFAVIHLAEELLYPALRKKSPYATLFRLLSISVVIFFIIQAFQVHVWGNYFQKLQLYAPFLVLPLVLLNARPLGQRSFRLIIDIFILAVSLVSVAMLVNYLRNYEHYNMLYAQSKVMSGIISHIRFSIMIAFASYLAYFRLFTTKISNHVWRICMWVQFGLLLVFCHVYAVRGGLLALYTLLVFEMLRYFISRGQWRQILLILIATCTLIACTLIVVPTMRNKLAITMVDLQQYQKGFDLNHNSLGKRLVSYQIAWQIVKENPVLGCGLDRYEQINSTQFNLLQPGVEVPIIAHNQFIYWLAATGIIGMLLLSFAFFFPIYYLASRIPILLLAHLLVLFVSFQTEPMLETQLGIAYSIWFWLLPMCGDGENQ